jgi:hypothetical protein
MYYGASLYGASLERFYDWYSEGVRRLLQLGLVLLLMATFLTPITELFDRWDAAGLGNDTEFPLFLFVLFICLVLLVAKLVSLRALTLQFVSRSVPLPIAFAFADAVSGMLAPVPPHNSSPLRI